MKRTGIIDSLDTFILLEIFNSSKKGKDSNNWEIARKWAKLNNEKNIDKAYMRIKARLKIYCNSGIFFLTKNGNNKNVFNMDLNKIGFIKHKFEDGTKLCLMLRT
jgi:hypothetical protein